MGLSTGGGLVDVLVTLCLFWVLVRIPSWASRAVFNGGGSRPGVVRRAVRTALEVKSIRSLAAVI